MKRKATKRLLGLLMCSVLLCSSLEVNIYAQTLNDVGVNIGIENTVDEFSDASIDNDINTDDVLDEDSNSDNNIEEETKNLSENSVEEDTDEDIENEDTPITEDEESLPGDSEKEESTEDGENEIISTEEDEEALSDNMDQDEAEEDLINEDEDSFLESGISWNIDSNGCLYVSGEGDLPYKSITMHFPGDSAQMKTTIQAPEWIDYRDDIKSAKLNISGMTDLSYMFVDCENLKSIEYVKFDTSKVTNMKYMFAYCFMLESIPAQQFDYSNVTNMAAMFASCTSLKNISLENKDLSKVTDMMALFHKCSALQEVNLSGVNTSSLTGMRNIFAYCTTIEKLDLNDMDTENLVDAQTLFEQCTSLETLNINKWNTGSMTKTGNMFSMCENLTYLNLDGWDFSKMNSTFGMFLGCKSLEHINAGFNMSSSTDAGKMFYECESLKGVDLSGGDWSNVTSTGSIFTECTSLTFVKSPRLMPSNSTIKLPAVTGKTWKDSSGKEVTYIPSGLKQSTKYIRSDYKSEDEKPLDPIGDGYRITYELNGGINNAANPSTYKGTVTLKAPTKGGYKFVGWYKKSNNKKITTVTNENVTVVAKWSLVNYSISYVLNGGSIPKGTDKPTSYNAESPNIILPIPVRKGYKFKGWYKDSAFSDYFPYIQAGSYGKLKLYAKWQGYSYTIKFNSNTDDDLSGIMNDLECEYGKSYNLPLNSFDRAGYYFNGWATTSGGSGKKYKNGAKFSNLAKSEGEVITLYAQWKKISYSIQYMSNGGKGKTKAQSVQGKDSVVIRESGFTRAGYSFWGWNSRADGTGTWYYPGNTVDTIEIVNKAKCVLYAQWMQKAYTVFFDGNGNTSGTSVAPAFVTYEEKFFLPKCSFTKDGCRFAGWSTSKNGGKVYQPGTCVSKLSVNDSVTLYAKWVKESDLLIINYLPNGAEAGTVAETAIKVNKKAKLKKTGYVRPGYHLTGWNTEADGTGDEYSLGQEISFTFVDYMLGKRQMSLYAQWEPNKYVITYSPNYSGANYSTYTQECVYDRDCVLMSEVYSRNGYRFIGWCADKNGNGKKYSAFSAARNLTVGTKITLYAIWQNKHYDFVEGYVDGFPLPFSGKKYTPYVLGRYGEGFTINNSDNHPSYLLDFQYASIDSEGNYINNSGRGTYVYGRYKYANCVIDIGASNKTPVFAVADGTIMESGKSANGAYYVVIQHADSYSTYWHFSAASKYKKGEIVGAGDVIGFTGDSGSPGSYHLHFEWTGHDPYCTYYNNGNGYLMKFAGNYPHTHN